MAIPAFTLARRLRAGETVFCRLVQLALPACRRNAGREGFAAVTIEGQHGLWDVGAILNGIAAVRQGGGAPIVRVPLGDFALVSRALDFGAEGIIAPMINTADDARAFAAAAKFPPLGERSWGPHRAMTLGGLPDLSTYLREANDHIITLAMIETRTALQISMRSSARPGSTDFSSARPTCPLRCQTARMSIRFEGGRRASRPHDRRRAKARNFPAPIAIRPNAR